MDPHAERVRDMFSAIAGNYDLMNRILSLGMDLGWRRRAIRSLDLREAPEFLDACGGTGDLSFAFLREYPAGRAVDLDFSEPMLAVARERKRRTPGTFDVTLGDVLNLPFPAGRFDAVGCAFGIRNLSDLEGGISEFCRVLRPGGVLCLLEFTVQERTGLGRAVRWYVNRAVPALGRLALRNPGAYRYLSRSIESFAGADDLAGLLSRCGFEKVSWRSLSGGACTLLTAYRPA